MFNMTVRRFFMPRLASAKLSVSFSKMEDLDSVLKLEAREGARVQDRR